MTAALREFSAELQDRITKSALRSFAKLQMAGIGQGNARWLNPKHLAYRVKFWPSGIAWLGVGYRQEPGFVNFGGAGRSRRIAYDAAGVGWRSHFAELGYHTWGGGLQRPPGRKGKGWKRGCTTAGAESPTAARCPASSPRKRRPQCCCRSCAVNLRSSTRKNLAENARVASQFECTRGPHETTDAEHRRSN